MIERHVSLDVPAERADEFEHFFAEKYRPAAIRMPGLIECSLLRETDNPQAYQMVYRWESADEAAAWRTSKAHVALQPTLNALVVTGSIVAYTRVA